MAKAVKLLTLITLAAFLISISPRTQAQNCGCTPDLCCSQYGYCGSGPDYCGDGCKSGPCSNPGTPSGGSGQSVADIASQGFFDGIIGQADGGCEGKNFYTRQAFLDAAAANPSFGTTGSSDDSKREIAAFFAHATHETGHFCYINEIDGPSKNYCQPDNTQYPCVQGKGYYGRGPLQLSWNYNYGPAGQSVGFDGLNNPDAVASDATTSFKAAMWFWFNANVHDKITSGQGFGSTIQAINGMECGGGNSGAVNARIGYYQDYCGQFGVDPGTNLSC